MASFVYQDPFPLGRDETTYRHVTSEHVSLASFEGHPIVKVEAEGLVRLAREAMRDAAFLLRTRHLEQVAAILDDPEASDNDRGVALAMLRNAEVAADGVLPFCQDTGTATVYGKKGQQVWTGGGDEEALSRGIYETYTQENLRYSQTVPAHPVRGEELGHEPPRADRHPRRGRERVPLPLRGQGRRIAPTRPTSSRRRRRCSTRNGSCTSSSRR